MKLLIALLSLSLVANAAIFIARKSGPTASASTPAQISNPKPQTPPPPTATELLAQLKSGDPTTVEKLRALQFPEPFITALIKAQVDRDFEARFDALRPTPKNYWEPRDYYRNTTKDYLALNREKEALLKKLLGNSYVSTSAPAYDDYKLNFLPPEKAAKVRRIRDDYRELSADTESNFFSPALPEDKAANDLLKKEQRADLEAILTPAELFDYDLRHSSTANSLRYELSAFDATEAEFCALYTLKRAAEEKKGRDSGGRNSAQDSLVRRQAEESNDAETKALLGEARYAELTRARDSNYKTLHQIATYYKLPQATLLSAHDLSKTYDQRTQDLSKDPANKDPIKRQAALAALKQEAETQFTQILGVNGTQAFRENSNLFRRFTPRTTSSTSSSSAPVIITR
jgi:hypothetical protein